MSLTRKKKQTKLSKPSWNGHKYQLECVRRGLDQKFLAFFLDPGLGKTTIILQLYKILKFYRKSKGILVIAPIRVCELVWPEEVKKWSNFQHFKVHELRGNKKNLKIKADIYVTNPETLPWLFKNLSRARKNWPFDMVVCDESTLFKSHTSQRFHNIKQIVPKFERRYLLTGTPIPNGYEQLFSQMQIIDEGRSLGTKIGKYRADHFQPHGNPKWYQYKLREGEEHAINKKIAPYVMRVAAEGNIEMPELRHNQIKIKMPPKATKQYETLKKELFLEIEDKEIYPASASVLGMKLQQIANGCLYEDQDLLAKPLPSHKRKYFKLHDAKITAIKELQAELQYKPMLVAYWYYHDLMQLKKAFGKNCVALNKHCSSKGALKIQRDWNAGKLPVLLMNPASGAHGLNLQGAGSDVVLFSMLYDFELFDQFYRRIWRQGVKNAVTIHYLMSQNTIDQVIYSKLLDKSANQEKFFEIIADYQKGRYQKLAA